jgi:hypothetical protein
LEIKESHVFFLPNFSPVPVDSNLEASGISTPLRPVLPMAGIAAHGIFESSPGPTSAG